LFDHHNCDLFDQVRPLHWVDPKAKVHILSLLINLFQNTYDMLVIGAGAGGLVTAAGSKGVGAKVAIIEKKFMGGDCLNFGCVPSKAFLAAANIAHTVKV
jgi:ribulose 1,5-bisphosphate synthetase/thiazole synthase